MVLLQSHHPHKNVLDVSIGFFSILDNSLASTTTVHAWYCRTWSSIRHQLPSASKTGCAGCVSVAYCMQWICLQALFASIPAAAKHQAFLYPNCCTRCRIARLLTSIVWVMLWDVTCRSSSLRSMICSVFFFTSLPPAGLCMTLFSPALKRRNGFPAGLSDRIPPPKHS